MFVLQTGGSKAVNLCLNFTSIYVCISLRHDQCLCINFRFRFRFVIKLTAMLVVFTLLFVAACYAAPQEMGSHVYDAENDCFQQHPSITRDFLEGLKKVKKLPDDPSQEFKCFMSCVGKKIEAMSQEGALNFDVLKEITVLITGGDATHDDAHAMVSNCFNVDHDDNCEKAWKYVQCKVDELQPYKLSKGFCPSCHE